LFSSLSAVVSGSRGHIAGRLRRTGAGGTLQGHAAGAARLIPTNVSRVCLAVTQLPAAADAAAAAAAAAAVSHDTLRHLDTCCVNTSKSCDGQLLK